MDRRALVHWWRARRLSQILARRSRFRWQVSGDLGRVPHRWPEAEKSRASLRPDGRAHLRRRTGLVVPLSVVVGRQGGRGRGKTVVLNSRETVESVKFAVPLWKETM